MVLTDCRWLLPPPKACPCASQDMYGGGDVGGQALGGHTGRLSSRICPRCVADSPKGCIWGLIAAPKTCPVPCPPTSHPQAGCCWPHTRTRRRIRCRVWADRHCVFCMRLRGWPLLVTCWARCLRGPGRPSRDVSSITACPAAMLRHSRRWWRRAVRRR